MTDLQNITAYYHDCYQADLRSTNLINFFASKVKHQYLLESFELISGKMDEFPVDSAWGEEVFYHMVGYAKVESLYCGALFLKGKVKILGKTNQVVAPIYLYEAKVNCRDEVYYVRINRDKPIINPAILKILNKGIKSENAINYDQLTEAMPKGALNFSSLVTIENFFESKFPDLSITQLTNEETITIESLKKPVKKESDCLLVPAIGLGVVKKSMGSRGILTDLKKMSQQESFSAPVKTLFGHITTNQPIEENSQTANLPVSLSKNQLKVFDSVAKHTLSMVIGPPGTGKSFTIAALAIEFMAKGKTVLVASKNDQAVNVIAEKIAIDFELPAVISNTAKKEFKIKFITKIRELAYGMSVVDVDKEELNATEQKVAQLQNLTKKLQKKSTTQIQLEQERGQLIYDSDAGTLELKDFQRKLLKALRLDNQNWAGKYFPIQHLKKVLVNEKPLWDILLQIEGLNKEIKKKVRSLIQMKYNNHVNNTIKHSRPNLTKFLRAITPGAWSSKEMNFNLVNFTQILHAFPIWTVNGNEILDLLPLQAELFDLVIIDEATQCDIASVLPLLQRGRQAVIVGDPKQLRHLSFLSNKQQRNLISLHKLDGVDNQFLNYRENSILDLLMHVIEDQAQIQFLNEHFRSLPDIIRFSNTKFYNDSLTIMRSTPANQATKSVFHVPVKGKRYRGYNVEEAEAILQEIKAIIQEEENLEAVACQTIGVLSPFREQVDYLLKTLTKEISGQQFARHRILVGTAFSFQGEERDMMFLSFVLDDQSHASAYRFLNREDVFNVSITRARHLQKVFTSFDTGSFTFNSLLFDYVDTIRTKTKQEAIINKPEEDKFLKEVKQELITLNVKQILENYPIAGITLDLVVVNQQDQTLGIDLVGYPGKFAEAISESKWQILERVGIEVFFLPYSGWRFQKEKCVPALRKFLKS